MLSNEQLLAEDMEEPPQTYVDRIKQLNEIDQVMPILA